MNHIISPDRTKLTIRVDDSERKELRDTEECGGKIQCDSEMYNFLEPLTCNSELEWIQPAETGDLTDAPMLGIYEEDARGERKPVERWAFMDYQVRGVLEDLRDKGECVFVGGAL